MTSKSKAMSAFRLRCQHCKRRAYMSTKGICSKCQRKNDVAKLVVQAVQRHKSIQRQIVSPPWAPINQAVRRKTKNWFCTLCGSRVKRAQLRRFDACNLDVDLDGATVRACSLSCKRIAVHQEEARRREKKRRKDQEGRDSRRGMLSAAWRKELADIDQYVKKLKRSASSKREGQL